MATIKFLWRGSLADLDFPSNNTLNYFLGPTSGYYRPVGLSTTWTGAGLKYGNPNSYIPTEGVLFSWLQNSANFTWEMTGLNMTLSPLESESQFGAKLVSGKDEWLGDASANYFFASRGGDTYRGGGGIDVLDFSAANLTKALGLPASTTFRKTAGGAVTFAGSDRLTVTLDSVERLRFTDVSVALDLDGHAGKVAKVIGAVFGRDAVKNREYVGVGLSLFDAGRSDTEVMKLALDVRLGAGATSTDVINLLFRNLANTTPSTIDQQLFGNMLDRAVLTREELAWSAAETALNASNVGLVGLAASGLEYMPAPG